MCVSEFLGGVCGICVSPRVFCCGRSHREIKAALNSLPRGLSVETAVFTGGGPVQFDWLVCLHGAAIVLPTPQDNPFT